ncbi:hypothetical protein [Corallococcus sp. AB018]|uniref:hypothetical protein n=1 Tax=Corallococcus sp. AB018 TaxID=2316715 RepID=UPI000F863BA2|nr:hypothetical protein [Corallococcus sp. AB018]
MLEETRRLLTANGFTEDSPGLLSHSLAHFTRPTANGAFKIAASWSAVIVEHVELGLELSRQQPCIGTIHRAFSVKSFTKALSSILAELEHLASNPDLLKCPECGERYVHLKEPTGMKKFKPFLSCGGMRVVRRSSEGMRYKDIACRGISRKIPALKEYR